MNGCLTWIWCALLYLCVCIYTDSLTQIANVAVRSQTTLLLPPQQSVEQHLALLIEDLLKYGSQATVTAAEALVLREAVIGLHYVWRMR